MTYKLGGYTVGAHEESIKLTHEGKTYGALVTRAVHKSGKLCFVLRYEWRSWNPPIFGEGDYFVVLNRAHKVIAKSPYLDEALRQAEAKL